MDSIVQAIISFLRHNNNPLGLLILGLSAVLEYVFPPFPGDTVTLFGAFLVTQYQWSLPLVFGVLMIGSAVGAMMDFAIGVWIGKHYHGGRFLRRPSIREKVEKVLAAFQRHGEIYIVLNRFLPAVRAVFFLAAGMARLRWGRVLFFASLSAAVWNVLLIGVGYAVGSNWDHIQQLFRTYAKAAWGGLGVLLVGYLSYKGYQRWWGQRHDPPPP